MAYYNELPAYKVTYDLLLEMCIQIHFFHDGFNQEKVSTVTIVNFFSELYSIYIFSIFETVQLGNLLN